jgi:S-formylglutathione hydrolase
MEWSRSEVGGKPCEVFEPPGAAAPRFALLWLHDEDAVSPPPALTALLRRESLACAAPCGARSWWVDRFCPEFDPALTAERHLIDDVVPWMQARWNLGPRAIAVAGIGMGGQGAVRLGLKYPDQFPVVASLIGTFDFQDYHGQGTPLDDIYETRERARQDTAVLQLDPYRWPPHLWFACNPSSEWFRGNDRLHEKLRAYGVPHTIDFETTDADRGLEAMLAFVVKGLEREARRLV